MTVDLEAFADELEKIAIKAGTISGIRGALKARPSLIQYPLVAGGGITLWELSRRAKRRYDIGKAYEEAQGA